MNPYSHEFLSLLRRKAVIGVVIVAALAGSLGYVTISTTAVDVSGSGFWYFEQGSYHLDVRTFDDAGSPLQGIDVTLTVQESASNLSAPYMPPIVVLTQTASSDAGGVVQVDFTLPMAPADAGFQAMLTGAYPAFPDASFSGAFDNGFSLSNATAAAPQPINTPFNEVAQGFYNGLDRYLIVWAGPNGTAPTGDAVWACTVPYFPSYGPGYGPPNAPSNCTGAEATQRLGDLSGVSSFLPLPTLPTELPNGTPLIESVEIVNASGGPLYFSSENGYCSGACVPGAEGFSYTTPGPGLLMGYASELSLFLPLMALLLVYWSYARPRLTGTHEPVLARPVTRSGLFLTRYAAVAVALVAASAGEVVLLDVGLAGLLREPLPVSMLPPLIAGYAIASVGFAGLVFLMAHVFRSTGPVLGIAIALLLVFSIFWGEIVALPVLLSGAPLAPNSYGMALFRAQLAAPPQIPSAVSGLITNLPANGAPLGYVAAGVTGPVIASVSAAWIAVPFLLAYWRAATKD
jgi:ABC-type transport system involved in multi-copper enzyme maturation permease subunit